MIDENDMSSETISEVNKAKEILLSHGIKINIGSCGCCESPWVTLEYKGERIINERDMCAIVMIDEKKPSSSDG